MYIRSIFLFLLLMSFSVKAENIIESTFIECSDLGYEAEAIQMIRNDGNTSLDEILGNLDAMVVEEFGQHEPLFLVRVKAVGEWVYATYKNDFDPVLVGNTYKNLCLEKTMAQLQIYYPDLFSNPALVDQ